MLNNEKTPAGGEPNRGEQKRHDNVITTAGAMSRKIADLAQGKTGETRADCPNCTGSQKATLAVNATSGAFHCHRCHIAGNFFNNKKKQGTGHKSVPDFLWEQATPAATHPYLSAKGVKSYGLRVDRHENLVVPLSTDGKIVGLQFIKETGEKRLLSKAKGGQKKGACYTIGNIGKGVSSLYICEGYATAASVHEATGEPVVVAVDSGNLLPVAENLRQKYPDVKFIFAADNDRNKPADDAGFDVGYRKATDAAGLMGGLVCMPPESGQDFNDLHQQHGIDAVREALANTVEPEPSQKRKSASDLLVEIATELCHLFHNQDDKACAEFFHEKHRETWPVRGKKFRSWLSHRLFETNEKTAGGQALQDAVNFIEGAALFKGPLKETAVRLGGDESKIFLDLGGPSWEAVQITAEGWEIVTEPETRLIRPPGLRPLPPPEKDGDVGYLSNLVNLPESDFRLVIGWLLCALSPVGPFPILTFSGEQGTGKSTAGRLLRQLVDPNTANLRTTARSEQDLIIAAKNGRVIALDNLSGVKPWLSDALCRIATGGGFGARQLYTDDEEVLIEVQRPVIINGISELCTRPDLADRAIVINLPVIDPDKRLTEKKINSLFERLQGAILGGLLNAVSDGLRYRNEIKISNLPRLADAAVWWCACERGGALPWAEGGILDAFQSSREGIITAYVENDEVAAAVVDLLKNNGGRFEGTATELLGVLNEQRNGDKRSRYWPESGRSMSNRIKRAASFLRDYGISAEYSRTQKQRIIKLDYTRILSSSPSPSSPEGKNV